MSEYIVELPDSGAADEFVAKMGVEDCRIYGYRLTGEVVRCRDCRFASEVCWPENSGITSDYLDCHGELVETWDYYYDEPKDNPVRPDGFCAWGERRES